MKYAYENDYQVTVRVNANVVGRELQKLVKKNKGALLPETVVKAARPKKSPIHECFEWDDKKAAHLYRTRQAGCLLRAVVIVEQDPETEEMITTRAFPCIETEGGNYYTSVTCEMSDPELYENVTDQIYRQLKYLREKHKRRTRFQKVWQAVDKLKI